MKTRLVDASAPPFQNALRIFPKIRTVRQFNEQKLQAYGGRVYEVVAHREYTNREISANTELLLAHIPKDDRDAGGLSHVLQLAVNARVFLCRNILASEGLVNGQLGTVTGFDFACYSKIPSVVYVKFDNPLVGAVLQLSTLGGSIAIEVIQYAEQIFHCCCHLL